LFWPYWMSVILVALAIYGLWQLWCQLVRFAVGPRSPRELTVSLLVVVRNAETTVEGEVRYLLQQAELEESWQEIVVIDHGSDDLTPAILSRLAERHPLLRAVCLPAAARPLTDGLALCRGEIIQILDLVGRLSAHDLAPATRLLLRK
jgi:cellulose synthase/poly-beta-1,6-N-acetylglucosamine synthase-like glycosyltransferase